MRDFLLLTIAVPVLLIPAGLEAQGPPAAQRGRALFFETGPKCATCHLAEGKGTKVGPDLTRLARLHPKGLKTAILSTVTEQVALVKLKSSASFPGIKLEQSGNTVKIWDLSKMPPEMRTLEASAIDSYQANAVWKHPPSSAGLSSAQLADIISFIRFSAYGDTKEVTAADVE